MMDEHDGEGLSARMRMLTLFPTLRSMARA